MQPNALINIVTSWSYRLIETELVQHLKVFWSEPPVTDETQVNVYIAAPDLLRFALIPSSALG